MNDRDGDNRCFVCKQAHWVKGRLVMAIVDPPADCSHRESSRTEWKTMKRRKSVLDAYLIVDEIAQPVLPIGPKRETESGFRSSVKREDAFRRRG